MDMKNFLISNKHGGVIKTLFSLKDRNDYKSCVIYKEDCSCGSHYIGETKRNAKVKWNEHNNTSKRTIETLLKQHRLLLYMGCHSKMHQKMLKSGKTLKHRRGNLILISKITLKEEFY